MSIRTPPPRPPQLGPCSELRGARWRGGALGHLPSVSQQLPAPSAGQATALSPPEGEAFGALGRGPQGGGTRVDRSWPPFSPAHEDSGPAAPLQARGQSHAEAGGDSPSKRPPVLPGGRRGCLPPPL